MCRRHREQALLPRFGSVPACDFFANKKSPVGAKLARDSGVSVCLDVGCAAVIASKLCSHSLDRCQPAISLPTKIPVGAKLARDSSVSVCLDVGCPPSSQASFGPTVWIGASLRFPCQQNPLWEQGLLAIAVCQSALMLDVLAVIASKLCSHSLDRCQPAISLPTKIPVGAKLARDSGVSVCLDVGCPPSSASKLCSHGLDRCQPAISLPTKIPCGSKACSR